MDAGGSDTGGMDAGGSDSGCLGTIVLDPSHAGPASLLDSSNPRLLYLSLADGRIRYTECISQCDGDAPLFSLPLTILWSDPDPVRRPTLRAVPGGLAMINPAGTNGPIFYGECVATDCTASATSWARVAVRPMDPTRGSAAFATLGEVRGLAAVLASGGAAYRECTSGCTNGNVWSEVVTGPSYATAVGASLLLESVDGGQLRRTAVWGGDALATPSLMLVRECTGPCTRSAEWHNVVSERGVYPQLVTDGTGLPRVLFLTRSPGGALKQLRCTQRPCAGPGATSWSSSVLVSNASSVAASQSPDGGSYFVAAAGGLLLLGVESPTGYSIEALTPCEGGAAELPATAWEGPRPRVVFGHQAELRFGGRQR